MLSDNYLPVAVFALIGLLFPIITFFITKYFRPEKATILKDTTYECGEVPVGEAQIQFNFQYYMFAIIFVVFDVVIAFLMVWALVFSGMSPDAKIYTGAFVTIFVSILVVGVFYALKKEAKIWI